MSEFIDKMVQDAKDRISVVDGEIGECARIEQEAAETRAEKVAEKNSLVIFLEAVEPMPPVTPKPKSTRRKKAKRGRPTNAEREARLRAEGALV